MTAPAGGRTFAALSALLTYPSEDLVAAIAEVEATLDLEGRVSAEAREALRPLLRDIARDDLWDLQARYCELFDRSRRLSLHLFEHIHGESRDRGQAMVDLASHYERSGLSLLPGELPDYLPLFLEFLGTRPQGEAVALLGETAHIVSLLQERVSARDTGYGAIFTAILSLAADIEMPVDRIESPTHENDLAALDAEWEETAVTFGPASAFDGCSADRLRTQVRAGSRDVRRHASPEGGRP